MKIMIILSMLVFLLLAAYGCVSSETITFTQGVKKINEYDRQFGATMEVPPNSTESINGLLAQLTGFRASNMDMEDSLARLLDFRIKTLEAEMLHIEGWQWGRGSSTDYGFGCNKGSARVLNSSRIRNDSAHKGYEAVDALRLFIDTYPEQAKSLDLSQKHALFLDAAYRQVEEKASNDAGIISNLCMEQIAALNGEGVI